MIKFHPSSVGLLMADAKSIDMSLLTPELASLYRKKSKTAEEQAILAPYWDKTLSVGAKTYLMGYAKEFLYGYSKVVTTKYMEKGNAVEQRSIDLYNRVHFTSHKKNTERRQNDWLTGECDIHVPNVRTIDVKSSWDIDTFPVIAADCHDPLYEWQGRAYGILWPDTLEHRVAHCLVDTPEELIKWEQKELHRVEHHHPSMRVTEIIYPRDEALNAKLEAKCKVAQRYLDRLVAQIRAEHGLGAITVAVTAPKTIIPTMKAYDE